VAGGKSMPSCAPWLTVQCNVTQPLSIGLPSIGQGARDPSALRRERKSNGVGRWITPVGLPCAPLLLPPMYMDRLLSQAARSPSSSPLVVVPAVATVAPSGDRQLRCPP